MHFHKSIFLQALLLLAILTGCGTTAEQATPSPTPQPAPTATEKATAADTTTTATLAPPHPLPPTPTNAAIAFPGDRDEALIPLPGIVYENSEGTWLVEADGVDRLLTAHTDVEVSPDGKQGLICADGDVVLLDFAGGEKINLTEGSGRVHYSAAWWPAHPETLVLTSVSPEEEGPNAGRLTLVQTDGSGYHVVQTEREVGFAFPAPAPDGQTIAFDSALSGMLYHVDDTVEPFSPSDYSLPPGIEVARMGSPAWSPDGKWLAWMLGLRGGPYGEGEVWDGVLGVFHLDSHTATLIHPFRPAGRGGWFRPAVWSTDGRWLTFDVESADPAENGLWVTDPFGLVERRLRSGAGYPLVWSPAGEEHWANGNTLLIARPHWRARGDNRLLVSGGWKETALVLAGTVVDWLPSGVLAAEAPSPPIAETAPPPVPDPGAVADENRLTEPPAGLLLALGSMDRGWDLVVAGEGDQLRTVVEQIAPAHYYPDFDVSPDSRQLLYVAAGDIWLLDIATSVTVNVTNTPGRQEQVPRWLPGGEGFVCGSKPVEPEGNEDPFPGYLTRVGFNGTYEVLVETGRLPAPPAPAPDGETIAYSRAHERRGAPFLYRLGSGERPLVLASFDLDWVEKIWEASWSPDGQRLAWSVAGERDGEWIAGEILLNLAEGTYTLLHSYRPLGMGGFIPAPRWAPDGSWLVFVARDEQPGGQGIWKVDLESGLKEQLFSGCLHSSLVRRPAISPDGGWIAAPACGAGGDVRLLDGEAAVTTWQAPAEVAAVAWTNVVGHGLLTPPP